MRLSIHKDDVGYDLEKCKNCVILLDGIDITDKCFTADEEKGLAYCYMHNDDGRPYLDKFGNLATEAFSGEVRIILNGGS